MLIEAITIVMLAQARVDRSAVPVETVRDKVCKLRRSAMVAGGPGLIALPEQKRANATGVVLLVNCTNRMVVDLRDPSNSQRNLNKFVYARGVTARLPGDPNRYEVLNFNAEVHNSPLEHTVFLNPEDWSGRCDYKGLQLTTAAPDNPADRQTINFDLNICTNVILALVKPPKNNLRYGSPAEPRP